MLESVELNKNSLVEKEHPPAHTKLAEQAYKIMSEHSVEFIGAAAVLGAAGGFTGARALYAMRNDLGIAARDSGIMQIGKDALSSHELRALDLRAGADRHLAVARNRFFEIAGGGLESNDVRAAKLDTEALLQFLKGPEYRSWVSAEKAAGNEVFWPTDVDKTLSSGDIFTHYFKWRADNNKFSPEQLNIIQNAVKELVPSATSGTPQDVLRLWQAKEAGGEGISMLQFWSKIYWPSQKGMSAAEKLAQVNEFAPTFADKVYPLVKEVNHAIENAGGHVVIVSNGDEELARAASRYLGVKEQNVVGTTTIYDKAGISTGTNHSYEMTEGPWTKLPQPGKPMNFRHWLEANKSRFGWSTINENRDKIAGFNGDSAAADGGMMIFSNPKAIGNFMVDTPGEKARIEGMYKLADEHGRTKGEFITLLRQPSQFDLTKPRWF